jgi:hypothetical protein
MRLSPILLSVALLCASGLGMAAESRQLSPDGDGNCPETAAASNEATDETDPDAAAAPARRTQKAKPAPATRSGGGGSAAGQRNTAPRWHSFLPGMFR